MTTPSAAATSLTGMTDPDLASEMRLHSEKCIECKLCRKECLFLQQHGNPKQIADSYDPEAGPDRMLAFECSLCGLCGTVCPVGINPSSMFLAMRRHYATSDGDFSAHGVILGYERRGTSRQYTYYGLPADCDTILFPGCALPGTRPAKVRALFALLQQTVPNLGIVLDCCTKPSHDLGRDSFFHAMFDEMKKYLLARGVKRILVACPNCYRVFKQYGAPLAVATVYEHLAESGLPDAPAVPAEVTVHDPCGTRAEEHIHASIRRLLQEKAITVEEMPHHGGKTICCGEGGSVGCLNPELAKNWGARRGDEAGGKRIVTYCAGCANFLQAVAPTSHILDVLFEPTAALAGKAKVAKTPWTYINRLLLKRHFRKTLPAANSRERTFSAEPRTKGNLAKRLALLLVVVAAIVGLRLTGATAALDQESLRAIIAACGPLAPAVYILIYAIAPTLLLPGLPLTIAGGILFGPFWGVLYTITGATIGCCVAFLVARYVGRGWVEKKLKNPRWRQLDAMVEEHGWKAVAFTRLIPIFPFNLLNYAFGLTKVKFHQYAITSLLCMLPACIAFIVFSSSLLDLVTGTITPSFVIGLVLILAVSLAPLIYKKYRRSRHKS
ncbi:MAG: VTT domain-containing protein [Thermodesulfobacteriota bacterium]